MVKIILKIFYSIKKFLSFKIIISQRELLMKSYVMIKY